MDTISRKPQTPQRPAGIPADWEPTLDNDGTVLDWYGHKKQGPFLNAEAIIDPTEDPTLTPKFYLTIDNERTMTAADLHEFAGRFFEFYREVCTHLPGVEVPQRLASTSAADAGMEV